VLIACTKRHKACQNDKNNVVLSNIHKNAKKSKSKLLKTLYTAIAFDSFLPEGRNDHSQKCCLNSFWQAKDKE
jgi:hypothetical protein